ncbi:MAG: OmpH family outer membrane protein [Bacteroidetes bacterium]|nr:OmpH family outer membrane protein [Bacteroidota bacterium]
MLSKVALGINVVLLALVAYLFVQLGNLKKGEANESAPSTQGSNDDLEQTEDGAGIRVAFVRGDSIMLKYKFVEDEQNSLIQKAKSSENKLQRRMTEAEKEYQGLVEYANSGSATERDLQITQNRIMELEYELQQMQAEEQQKIARVEMEFQKELYDRISDYLKIYGEENGIDMIFNYEPAGQTLLYSLDAFDVTNDVVEALNQKYEAEQAPEK